MQPPAHDTCGILVTDIWQNLTRSKVWDYITKEKVGTLYLEIITPAAAASKKAIASASAQIIRRLRGAESSVDFELIEAIATATTESYRELDMDTFTHHFGPRLQQLVEADSVIQWSPAVLALTGNDIANVCRGALADYQQIQNQTIKHMETALPDNTN